MSLDKDEKFTIHQNRTEAGSGDGFASSALADEVAAIYDYDGAYGQRFDGVDSGEPAASVLILGPTHDTMF